MDFTDKEVSSHVPSARTPLWCNTHFNIFWFGQSLSVLGDACALLALPLLVLQATGSVAQMGLVTGTFSIGQLLAGIFAGSIADRSDRRIVMICCDLMRFFLYATIPLIWWLAGPQIWLLYVVAALAPCFGTTFQVTYVTAIPNLVEHNQITEANSRLQTTFALAAIFGPILSGIVSAHYGPAWAISIDACSFMLSALSLLVIRLRCNSVPAETTETPEKSLKNHALLVGAAFIWRHPILRPVCLFLACILFLTTGAFDLFIFHVKHDLGQTNTIVGLIMGLASIGGIAGGLATPLLRKYLGFGPCWIGGWIINALSLLLMALTSNLVFFCVLTMLFSFSQTIAGIISMSLRQQITPDAILGRVTSAFWTIQLVPAPLGAALFTAISARTGTAPVLAFLGVAGILIMLFALVTPVRQRFPEQRGHLGIEEKLDFVGKPDKLG